jgi:Protein of unknown function DUF262
MRRHNFQTISWFYDLWTRELLDLDPPYQRRSVWGQQFKDYFVDTVLLNYPAPALFLYEEIGADGRSIYHVVDGKQRLTTIFHFIRGDFPVSDKSDCTQLRGKYFSALEDGIKKSFWGYQFLVEYIPDDEKVINAIFDRINRNVAKLTAQELRHARLDGAFIKTAEDLSEWVGETLPKNFPRFAHLSRQQMKDVEFVAILLLLVEEGPKSYSQDGLDDAFTKRDELWEPRIEVSNSFREVIRKIREILDSSEQAKNLLGTRLRNQADFYSLFGAIYALQQVGKLCAPAEAATRLLAFAEDVEDEAKRISDQQLMIYFDAARSASNDRGPREARIAFMSNLLSV